MNTMTEVVLKEEECACSVIDLYKNIGKQLLPGANTGEMQFDCREVQVTKDVFEAAEGYYADAGQKDNFPMVWMMVGPKANLEGGGFRAVVTDQFVSVDAPKEEVVNA